jgi:hypothetical protein
VLKQEACIGKGRNDFRVLAEKKRLKNGYLGDKGWLGG